MYPSREEAHAILKAAGELNPGPWINHVRVAAYCADKIASSLGYLDADKAYVQGLLHDIGRKFGTGHLRHVYDGYKYMLSLGYDEVARTCLTHSFQNPEKGLEEYIGKNDLSEAETEFLLQELKSIEIDEYDRLIQLCDGLAGSDRVLDLEDRMNDVKERYGWYPKSSWDSNLETLADFEAKLGRSVYEVVDQENFRIDQEA